MELADLIGNYRSCETALGEAIGSDANAAIRELDVRMRWLRANIRDHAPTCETERSQQVSFFIEAIADASDMTTDSPLFEDLRSVIERQPPRAAPDPTAQPVFNFGPNPLEKIERSDIRILAADRNLNCLYASPASNAGFPIPAGRLVGRNMYEIIGSERFDKRARRYFDRCLAGDDQCYCVYEDLDDGRRQLLECRLLAQRDVNGSVVGMIIVLRDLTANVADPIASAEANRI